MRRTASPNRAREVMRSRANAILAGRTADSPMRPQHALILAAVTVALAATWAGVEASMATWEVAEEEAASMVEVEVSMVAAVVVANDYRATSY